MLCWVTKFIHKVQPHNHRWLVIWFLTCWRKEFDLAVRGKECLQATAHRASFVEVVHYIHWQKENQETLSQFWWKIILKAANFPCFPIAVNGNSDTNDAEQCAVFLCGKGLIAMCVCNRNVIDVSGIKVNEKTTIVHSEIQT